jgi:hypothetical protein
MDAAGCRCIFCCCRCIHRLHPFPVIWITSVADCRCILCCCRCIPAASLPRNPDHSCSRLQMHFMLLQMHPRYIPSPRSGSQLQQTADEILCCCRCIHAAFLLRDLDHSCSRLLMRLISADASTLHPLPVIWITAAADC